MQNSSLTTKLRVVFNGSVKNSKGNFFNDMQLRGPRVQRELVYTLIEWRTKKHVFITDIEKMYRQFLITEDQRDLQRILWYKEDEICEF